MEGTGVGGRAADNRVESMSMASIFISSDAYQRYESGPVAGCTDVDTANNNYAKRFNPTT